MKKNRDFTLLLDFVMLITLSGLISFQGSYLFGVATVLLTAFAFLLSAKKKVLGYLVNSITATGLFVAVFFTNFSTIEDPHLSCFDVCIGSDMLLVITKFVGVLAFILTLSLLTKELVEKQ